jgi:hypothetical protein
MEPHASKFQFKNNFDPGEGEEYQARDAMKSLQMAWARRYEMSNGLSNIQDKTWFTAETLELDGDYVLGVMDGARA